MTRCIHVKIYRLCSICFRSCNYKKEIESVCDRPNKNRQLWINFFSEGKRVESNKPHRNQTKSIKRWYVYTVQCTSIKTKFTNERNVLKSRCVKSQWIFKFTHTQRSCVHVLLWLNTSITGGMHEMCQKMSVQCAHSTAYRTFNENGSFPIQSRSMSDCMCEITIAFARGFYSRQKLKTHKRTLATN